VPILTSIQVGLPKTHAIPENDRTGAKPWRTAYVKEPVSGPVEVEQEKLAGDGQADRRVHGGVDKAVLAYPADHYPLWQQELGHELPLGAFAENLSISGQTEADVCLGDIWRIGNVELQISQPRQPCWKIARHWNNKMLPKLVAKTGRSGWYLRVIETGQIEAGMKLTLVDRLYEKWTVERANRAMYDGASATDLIELASLPEVSRAWIKDLPA